MEIENSLAQPLVSIPLDSDKQQPNRRSILRGHDEFYNIGLPAVFIAIALLAVWQQPLVQIPHLSSYLSLVANILFLNIIHVAFTYQMLMTFPEARSWCHDRAKVRGIPVWAEMTLVFLALLLLTRAAFFWLDEPGLQVWFLVVFNLLQAHHGLRQQFGISQIYSSKISRSFSLSSIQKAKLEQFSRYERAGFNLLLLFQALNVSLFRGEFWPADKYGSFRTLVGFMIVAFILWSAAKIPYASSTNKSAFLARLVLFPIGVVTPWAVFGISCLHGMEYLWIYRAMRSRSSCENNGKYRYLLILLIAVIGAGLFFRPTDFGGVDWPSVVPSSPSIKWIAAISYALGVTHFYMDRVIFRMRDPVSRSHFERLLVDG